MIERKFGDGYRTSCAANGKGPLEAPFSLPESGVAHDAGYGTFEGYASLFGLRDRSGDIVQRGAFRRTLQGRKPKDVRLLLQHNAEAPIGIRDEIHEDARGLFVRGRIILDVPRGRETWTLMQEGAIDGLSIGFKTVRAAKPARGKGRTLTDIDLWEISLVTFPLLSGARVSHLAGRRQGEMGSGVTLTHALRQATKRFKH